MHPSDPLSSVRSLGPLLRDRSSEIESNRGLPTDVVAALGAEGLFRFWVPRSVGGGEADAVTGARTIVELARHDAATAWCVMIANTTGLLAGFLERRWAEAVFGSPEAIVGGFAQPVGQARPTDDGLEVTGRWPWGSGSGHSTAMGGGTLVVGGAGTPEPRPDGLAAPFVFLDRSQIDVLDTWHTLGLAGSGSNDYTACAAMVPEGRWVQIGVDDPVEDGPLYRYSLFGLLAAGVAAVAVGTAGRALEEFEAMAATGTPQGSRRLLAERAASQALAADGAATIRSARAHLDDTLGSAWTLAESGRPIATEHRAAIRLAATDATRRCVDLTVALFRAAGGEAVYRRNPLERVVRDALVIGQHAMVADRTREMIGRLSLGLGVDERLL